MSYQLSKGLRLLITAPFVGAVAFTFGMDGDASVGAFVAVAAFFTFVAALWFIWTEDAHLVKVG